MTEGAVIPVRARAGACHHRKLKISILRYNPQEPASVPHMQTYDLGEADGMTLFIALNERCENRDVPLHVDLVRRDGSRGRWGMGNNGRPALACRPLTKNLGPNITL